MFKQVVTIENIDHAFGKGELCKPVLFDIDLNIEAGEIVIMTGPSGSGKTTLLTLIGGFDRYCLHEFLNFYMRRTRSPS